MTTVSKEQTMHELSIAQGIIEVCEQHAKGRPVTFVSVQIGALSGVVPEALEFCYEAAVNGTLLEGSRLEIERIAATGHCESCGVVSEIAGFTDPCPCCGGFPLEIRSGEEMRVKELEVD
jgi:hydrogenase nickel incorporation protein HypA/HybF